MNERTVALLLSILSVGIVLSFFIDVYAGSGIFAYIWFIYLLALVPIAWMIALVALALRDKSTAGVITLALAGFTLGLWPAIALGAIIQWLTHDYAWPVRFWSATSLLVILKPVWYLWAVPTLATLWWIGGRRRTALRKFRWFQLASLASIVAVTFPCCVVSVVALADWPLVCVMWPLAAAFCLTTFSWVRGRRFRAARPLRLVAGAVLPTIVIFASVPHLAAGSPTRWPTWLAFRISSLGVPFLLLSLALFLAPDPGKRKRRRRPAARPVEGKDTSGPANTGTDAMEDVR